MYTATHLMQPPYRALTQAKLVKPRLQCHFGALCCLAAKQHDMYTASHVMQLPCRELTQAELDTRAFIAHLT